MPQHKDSNPFADLADPNLYERDEVVPVTVERTVGEITISKKGEEHPLLAAMKVVGTYEADHEEGGVYRFMGTTIEVTHTRDGDGPKLTEWLEHVHPGVLAEYRREF